MLQPYRPLLASSDTTVEFCPPFFLLASHRNTTFPPFMMMYDSTQTGANTPSPTTRKLFWHFGFFWRLRGVGGVRIVEIVEIVGSFTFLGR